MATRPVVVFVGERYGRDLLGDHNPYEAALFYHLREIHWIDVFSYRYASFFVENILQVKRFIQRGELIAIVIRAEKEYDEFVTIEDEGEKDYELVIRETRGLSEDTPIIVVPECGDLKDVENLGKNVFIERGDDQALIKSLHKLKKNFNPRDDYFGAESLLLEQQTLDLLQLAYQRNYLEKDNYLYAPDVNHQQVAEALRLRLLPPELVSEEFDKVIGFSVEVFSKEAVLYQKEVEQIRKMRKKSREALLDTLHRIRTCGPVGCGRQCAGFAIDSKTFEFLITSQFGAHFLAQQMLARRITEIEELGMTRSKRQSCNLQELEIKVFQRIVHGLIHFRVDGFKTPILVLLDGWEEDNRFPKVGRYILGRREFIPVDHRGKLVE